MKTVYRVISYWKAIIFFFNFFYFILMFKCWRCYPRNCSKVEFPELDNETPLSVLTFQSLIEFNIVYTVLWWLTYFSPYNLFLTYESFSHDLFKSTFNHYLSSSFQSLSFFVISIIIYPRHFQLSTMSLSTHFTQINLLLPF